MALLHLLYQLEILKRIIYSIKLVLTTKFNISAFIAIILVCAKKQNKHNPLLFVHDKSGFDSYSLLYYKKENYKSPCNHGLYTLGQQANA